MTGVDLKAVRESLRDGAVNQTAEEILEECAGEELTKNELAEKMSMETGTIGRKVSFFESQEILEKVGEQKAKKRPRPLYTLSDKYQVPETVEIDKQEEHSGYGSSTSY